MRYLETCLLIAEADEVLCHLLMILTVFFHCMYKVKYSCYQEYFVVHGWFVYWILVKKCAACQKSDFGKSLLTSPCLKSLKPFWPYLMASGPASRLVSLSNYCI